MDASLLQRKKYGHLLCQISLLIYLVWLLLPTLQELLHSYPGLLSMGLLGTGMALDWEWFRKNWWKAGISALFALLLSLAGGQLLRHGVGNLRSFLVSRTMFWYPVILAGYCFTSDSFRLDRRFHALILILVGITAAVTIFWNAEGLLHRMDNGTARCYSRLIYDRRVSEAEISSYNLRGIGSLPFIYAEVLLLPLLCLYAEKSRGRKRLAYIGFILLNGVCIALSQFTYALVFAGLILAVELLSLLIHRVSRQKIGRGLSMLLACIPFVLLLIFIDPLSRWAFQFASSNRLSFLKASLKSLCQMTEGGLPGMLRRMGENLREIQQNPPPVYLENGEWNDPGRLTLYLMSLAGFLRSPLIGSLGGGEMLTGYHSDLLDALTASGILGVGILSGLVLWLLRPCGKVLRKYPRKAHFLLAAAAAVLITLLTTYLCCREISAVFFTEMILLLTGAGEEKASISEQKK